MCLAQPVGRDCTASDLTACLAEDSEDFDFVVMAVGNFSKPFIPELNHSHFMGRCLPDLTCLETLT